MLDKQNDLIVIKNSIFKKVINFFKRFFKLEKNKSEENKSEKNKLEENKLEENKLEESKLEENRLEETKLEKNNIEENNLEKNHNEEFETMEESSEGKNIFLKEGVLDILNNNDEYNSNFIEYDFESDLNYDEEKERIFNVYNTIKNEKTDFEKLDNMTLIQLNQMLETEIKLRVSKKAN